MPEDVQRRRLTRDESVALLSRPLAGVFSSLNQDGSIHSVPVFFLFVDEEIRIVAGATAVKSRNVERTGQATLCVEVTDGSTRSFVTVSGPVAVEKSPSPSDLQRLDGRYQRTDFVTAWDDPAYPSVLIVLRPARWVAWADWD